jgi:glycosyltransferase involved in cell wall biosynthesis
MKLTLIVPAYNEAPVIGVVLRQLKVELRKLGKFQIVVVDDGSTDGTGAVAGKEGVKVITHPLNRGLGGALGTGFAYAKLKGSDILVTFDADGQHDPSDIVRMIAPLVGKRADVVIGSRTLRGWRQLPLDRRIILLGGNLLTRLLFGVKTSDSQSGFRAFSRKAISKLSLKTQGMEVSSEFFSEIKAKRLKFVEVPVKVIYSDYSRRKGQSNLNAMSILIRLILRLGR